MRVQNKVGAFVQAQRHAVRLDVRNRSRLPEEQMAVGIESSATRSESPFRQNQRRVRLPGLRDEPLRSTRMLA